ncbi:hypothetical protein H3009_gp11 [Bacillus phage Harambe]|uniref:Uncharacterized protein n=1 Tax=Bacillus phage Harambe TaxID=1981931 RepID=A0A1W6JSB9_9CAUD|nr:hypothetical protein H3009_gp11 [Bacillus phage Harambe]ARM70160.1 hypothetical protein HARAMBE_11 [Bacillus phage Harambe]
MMETKRYDFTGKVSGSTTPNPAVAELDGVEFTQEQYDNIFGASLKFEENHIMRFTFPIDIEFAKIRDIDMYFTSKTATGEIELVAGDYGVYQRENEFKQKKLSILPTYMEDGKVVFTITNTTDIEIYGVLVDVWYDEDALNRYSGTATRIENGGSVTDTINNVTFKEVMDKLNGYPENSVDYVTFARVPYEGTIDQ